jgi:hypothetical protein
MFGDVVVAEVNSATLSPVSGALIGDGQGLGAGGQRLLHSDPLTVDLVQRVFELAEFRFELRLPEVDVADALSETGVDFLSVSTSSVFGLGDQIPSLL